MTNNDSSVTGQVPAARKGVSRLFAAAAYSVSGLKAAFKSEEAFRLEVYVVTIMAPFGLWFGQGSVEKVLLVGSLLLLLIIELLNTAIEIAIDRIGPEFHELSKKAKDVGSACVLLGIGLVLFTWTMILLF